MCINLQTDLDVKCWGLFSTVFYNSLFFSFFSLSLLFLPPSHCLYSMSTRCDSDSFLLLFWWSLIGLGTPEAVNEEQFQSLDFFLHWGRWEPGSTWFPEQVNWTFDEWINGKKSPPSEMIEPRSQSKVLPPGVSSLL